MCSALHVLRVQPDPEHAERLLKLRLPVRVDYNHTVSQCLSHDQGIPEVIPDDNSAQPVQIDGFAKVVGLRAYLHSNLCVEGA
jgi:hypothetical protein